MPLAWLGQEDFSAGAIRSVARHLIPPNGVYSVENGLLDSDGSIYRRGGSEYISNAPFGVLPLTWLWTGHLAAGPRTLIANEGAFAVLGADGATMVSLGGPGPSSPVRAVAVNGMLFVPGGTIYGGSLKAADYAVGTVAVTAGSVTATGTGTSWLANVDAGMLFRVVSGGRYYVVASVESDTSLTLADPYEGATGSGFSYGLTRLGSAASPYVVSDIYATVAERLVAADGSRIAFSRARSEAGVLQPHVFDATDYHELPEGAVCLGVEALRDSLIVFATDGIWVISNMSYDLTDAAGNVQQQMQRTSQDLVLWGAAGVAAYGGALVVPATDGVYLVDGASPPVPLSLSIEPLLAEYVREGCRPGGATVFNGHYFLPVLEAESTSVLTTLVCRVDRPVRVRGRAFFPWSWLSGHGGNTVAVAQRVSTGIARSPELVAAGESDRRLLNLTRIFTPTAATKNDASGALFRFEVETRDFPTGTGNVNTVRRARVRYELIDAAADNPTLEGSYSVGTDTLTALTPDGPADTGANRHTWLLAADARYFRLRLESTEPAARLTLRSVEIAVRQSGKDR